MATLDSALAFSIPDSQSFSALPRSPTLSPVSVSFTKITCTYSNEGVFVWKAIMTIAKKPPFHTQLHSLTHHTKLLVDSQVILSSIRLPTAVLASDVSSVLTAVLAAVLAVVLVVVLVVMLLVVLVLAVILTANSSNFVVVLVVV